jgi:hypothetical protein
MVRDRVQSVREMSISRAGEAKPPRRPPRRTTKHMHERLLRALGGDRRVKRAFD